MRIAKPILLVTTPLGVAGAIYEAFNLAGGLGFLMVAFVAINVIPQARALFALAPLGWTEVGLIAGAVAIWLPLVRLLWRKRLIARFLGMHDAKY